jgi:hypothetical protein
MIKRTLMATELSTAPGSSHTRKPDNPTSRLLARRPVRVARIGSRLAQTVFEPIVDGRRPQPTQQRFESRQSTAALEQGRRVQSEIDRLYGDVVAGSAPTGR